MAVTILAGIVLLPILISLYLVPSVREAFDQLAYEDAMRGWRCNAGNPAKFIKKRDVLA